MGGGPVAAFVDPKLYGKDIAMMNVDQLEEMRDQTRAPQAPALGWACAARVAMTD